MEPIYLFPNSPTPNATKIVFMDNARAINPVTIDSTGEDVVYLQPNSNYTMSGTETYVNSGFMLPQLLSPPGSPAIEEFTVTFVNLGTYNYTCVLHPWMTGAVRVS